jgi:hypothetical protein
MMAANRMNKVAEESYMDGLSFRYDEPTSEVPARQFFGKFLLYSKSL